MPTAARQGVRTRRRSHHLQVVATDDVSQCAPVCPQTLQEAETAAAAGTPPAGYVAVAHQVEDTLWVW